MLRPLQKADASKTAASDRTASSRGKYGEAPSQHEGSQFHCDALPCKFSLRQSSPSGMKTSSRTDMTGPTGALFRFRCLPIMVRTSPLMSGNQYQFSVQCRALHSMSLFRGWPYPPQLWKLTLENLQGQPASFGSYWLLHAQCGAC